VPHVAADAEEASKARRKTNTKRFIMNYDAIWLPI